MRICLISREYPPDTGWGGIATFTRHLAHGLTEIGHDVEVVSLAKGEMKTSLEDGIRVHRVPLSTIADSLGAMAYCMPYSRYVLQASTALWRKFLQLHRKNPFDVVDTPELLAEGLVVAATKACPLAIRLYTPHSKFIQERLHNVTANFDHEFVAMLERIAMLSADALTSPSNDLAKFVANDLGYPLSDIQIICNPIDPGEFCPEGSTALQPDGRPTIMFVGRLEERKGIGYLIDAVPKVLERVPNAHFVIIGDDTKNANGQKSVLAELKSSIQDYGCGQSITFIPRIALAELPAHYRSADISVVPSVYDNSPYTCLEAMSCGRAVIGTSAGGTEEYILHGESGLIIPPRDSQALAEAIVRLLTNPDERKRIGDNARKRVLAKFQRQEIARETVELYKNAIAHSASNKTSALYLRDAQSMLKDAENFLYSGNRMIYDLLYAQSLRFRLRHYYLNWVKLLFLRPRLAAGKIFLLFAKPLLKLTGTKHAPAFLRKLSEEVEERSRPTFFSDSFKSEYEEDDQSEAPRHKLERQRV